MSHPGDDGGLGSLLDGYAFRAGDRAATNRGGMFGHGLGEAHGEVGVIRVKGQKQDDRTLEILDVCRLGFVSAFGISHFLLGEALGGSLRFEVSANLVNGRCRSPDSLRKDLPTFLLGNNPVVASRLNPACETGITGW